MLALKAVSYSVAAQQWTLNYLVTVYIKIILNMSPAFLIILGVIHICAKFPETEFH